MNKKVAVSATLSILTLVFAVSQSQVAFAQHATGTDYEGPQDPATISDPAPAEEEKRCINDLTANVFIGNKESAPEIADACTHHLGRLPCALNEQYLSALGRPNRPSSAEPHPWQLFSLHQSIEHCEKHTASEMSCTESLLGHSIPQDIDDKKEKDLLARQYEEVQAHCDYPKEVLDCTSRVYLKCAFNITRVAALGICSDPTALSSDRALEEKIMTYLGPKGIDAGLALGLGQESAPVVVHARTFR